MDCAIIVIGSYQLLVNGLLVQQNDDNWQQWFTHCLYRPFDWRSCYFSTIAVDYPRPELQQHMLQPNLSLNTVRQTRMPSGHTRSLPTPRLRRFS